MRGAGEGAGAGADVRRWTEFRRDMFAAESALFAEWCEALGGACGAAARRLERCAGGGAGAGGGGAAPAERLERDVRFAAERNRELAAALEASEVRLQHNQQQYEHYKRDQKLLLEEIKETYEAFLLAKKYYKKHLEIYYTIESSSEKSKVIYVQFFTSERKKKSENENYSIRIKKNTDTGKNELIDMTPMLATFRTIKKRLSESNDVPGALCCIRQSFLHIKQKK